MPNVPDRLRKLLQYLLEGTKTSQATLARNIGLSQAAISRIMTGDRQISADELFRIADYFKLDMRNIKRATSIESEEKLDVFLASIGGDEKSPYSGTRKIYPLRKDDPVMRLPDAQLKAGSMFFGAEKNLDKISFYWTSIDDDGMAPELRKGDIVVITKSFVGMEAVYAVGIGDDAVSARRIDGGHWEDEALIVRVSASDPKIEAVEKPLHRVPIKGLIVLRISSRDWR